VVSVLTASTGPAQRDFKGVREIDEQRTGDKIAGATKEEERDLKSRVPRKHPQAEACATRRLKSFISIQT